MYRKTSAVARLLGKYTGYIQKMIECGRIPAPAKDDSGDYIWSPEDIERARAAMAVDRRRVSYRAQRQATAVPAECRTAI